MASSDESLGEIKDNVILNEEEGDRVINKDNGKSFPKEAVDVLKQLYMKGMVGWGIHPKFLQRQAWLGSLFHKWR